MKLRYLLVAAPLLLAACSQDPLAEDIKEFDQLADKTVSKESTNELMMGMRSAKTDEDKAKLLGAYAETTRKQAETLATFKADTPEMKAVSEKISGGLQKASEGAALGQKAYTTQDQNDATKASQTMNEGMREFQSGAQDMLKMAREKKIKLSD